MAMEAAGPKPTAASETPAALLTALARQAALKHEALRDLAQAIQVAQDALQPLADNRPVSGPAQRAMIVIALMSLGQASEAVADLDDVADAMAQIFEDRL